MMRSVRMRLNRGVEPSSAFMLIHIRAGAPTMVELEEAGSIAEAALRINGVFEAAQRAAEQYLMNVKRLDAAKAKPPVFTNKEAEKRIPFESGWRAGIQRKGTQGRSRQMISMSGELHG